MDWTTIISIIGGGAFLSFLEYLVKRHDDKKGKTSAIAKAIEGVKQDVETLRSEIAADRASNARIRILGFSDELSHGVLHSKESFEQANLDIDQYRTYCQNHPDYQNNRGRQAIANIERVYSERLAKNDFLQ